MPHDAPQRFHDSVGPEQCPGSDCRPRSVVTTASTLFRWIRSAAAGFCLLLCAGALTLWLLSFKSKFEFFNNVTEWELYCVESWKGKLKVSHSNNIGKTSALDQWIYWSIPDARLYADYAQHVLEWEATTFDMTWTDVDRSLAMPHWAWVASAGLLAFLLKPRPKWQYGFHDLLILTTMTAILFGGFVFWLGGTS